MTDGVQLPRGRLLQRRGFLGTSQTVWDRVWGKLGLGRGRTSRWRPDGTWRRQVPSPGRLVAPHLGRHFANHSPLGSPLLTTPEHAVRAYITAFETLDPSAVAAFYHPPCLFISPATVAPVPDADAAVAMAGFLVQQAKAQGYRRSIIARLDTTILGPGLASATGSFIRLGSEDQEIMRFGFLYLLRQVEDRWLISVAVAHP